MVQVEKEKEQKPDPEFIIDESSVLNPDEVSNLLIADLRFFTRVSFPQIPKKLQFKKTSPFRLVTVSLSHPDFF